MAISSSLTLGAGGVRQVLPLGELPGLSDGNHAEGAPESLFPVLLLVETDRLKDKLPSLPSPGPVLLIGEGKDCLQSVGLGGGGNSNSSSGSRSAASFIPFIGVGAAGEGSAWTGLRDCVGRQAPGRVKPLPVADTDLGLPAGKAFLAHPLPLDGCGKLR